MSVCQLSLAHAVKGSAELRQQRTLVILLVASALLTWGVLVPFSILAAPR